MLAPAYFAYLTGFTAKIMHKCCKCEEIVEEILTINNFDVYYICNPCHALDTLKNKMIDFNDAWSFGYQYKIHVDYKAKEIRFKYVQMSPLDPLPEEEDE